MYNYDLKLNLQFTDTIANVPFTKVRFLAVPGTYNGETFPPGTGNVDAIVPSTSSLAGTSATVITTTVTEGADEMGGGFALSYGGGVTETLLYTADETSVEAVLEVRKAWQRHTLVQRRTLVLCSQRYSAKQRIWWVTIANRRRRS